MEQDRLRHSDDDNEGEEDAEDYRDDDDVNDNDDDNDKEEETSRLLHDQRGGRRMEAPRGNDDEDDEDILEEEDDDDDDADDIDQPQRKPAARMRPKPGDMPGPLNHLALGRWLGRPKVLLAFLSLLALANYYDRGAFTGALPRIKEDFDLDNTSAGLIGGAFIVGYAIVSPFMAHMSHHMATGKILMLGMLCWVMATALCGFATGFWSLMVVRCFTGVGEAAFICLSPSLIDDAAPSSQRAKWLAIFFSMLPIGYSLGFVGAGLLTTYSTWNVIFWSESAFVLPLAVLAFFIPNIRHGDANAPDKSKSLLYSVKRLSRNILYVMMTLGYAAQTFVFGALAYWLPDYIYNHYGLELGKTDIIIGIISLGCGIAGNGFASTLMDHLIYYRKLERNYVGVLLSLIPAVLSVPFALTALFMTDVVWFLTLMSFAEFMLFCTVTPVNATFLSSVDDELRGHAMAIATLCIHLFGDLTSPAIFGAISDKTSQTRAMGFLIVWLGWCILFWIISLAIVRKNRAARVVSLSPSGD